MVNKYDISDFPQILLIDTNDRQSTGLALVSVKTITRKTEPQRAQELLTLLERLLEESATSLKSINAIGVVVREGSLTGQRIGVTVANTLSWILNVPLLTIPGDIFSASQAIQDNQQFKISKILHAN